VGVVLAPAVVAGICLMGWVPVAGTDNPPRWERALAHRSFDAAVARQAPHLQNPIVATSDNLKAGMKLFRDGCAGCHGEAGKPSVWGTTSFYPRVPQFGVAAPTKPDWQIFWIIKHGVRYSGMGATDGLMPDDSIWKVATFLSHLKSLPPDVEAEWQGQTPAQ
jgi:mono/diheme cytochrome c family protein